MKLSFCSLVCRSSLPKLLLVVMLLLPALTVGQVQQNLEAPVTLEAFQATIGLLQAHFEEKLGDLQDQHDMLRDQHDALQDKHDSVVEEVSYLKKQGRNLQSSPFEKNGDDWVADSSIFVFPKGVIVGSKNEECTYGEGSFSVDGSGKNCPSGRGSVVFGNENTASGPYASVSGGLLNTASGDFASVSGGRFNKANDSSASISGGLSNTAGGVYASISGGRDNTASGDAAFISGGLFNTASGNLASVSGGSSNTASGKYGSVSGGRSNTASGYYASISGGKFNTASGQHSSVSGGLFNTAGGLYVSISGGRDNTADGNYASISGGKNNNVTGLYGSILGGFENEIEYQENEDQWFKMIPPQSRGACEDDVNFEYAGDVKPADSPRNCTDYVGFKPNKRCSKTQPDTGDPGIKLSFYCPKQCEASCK